jgi:secreted trypsin-like serine protease
MKDRKFSIIQTVITAGLAACTVGAAWAGPHPRIIGGTDSTAGEFPFMAALVQPASANSLYLRDYQAHFCGGTVIGARWVLTAAHCVEGLRNEDVQIITGVTTLADEAPFATRVNVSAILPHPLYDDDKIANDVALLYLATPVATSASFSVDDGTSAATLTDGADLTAIGWGITNQNIISDPNDDQFLPTLQKTVLDFVPFNRCNSTTFYNGRLHTSALCAGFSSGTARDTCFGDSGGPLMLPAGGGGWRQVGVTSYGATGTCALSTEPGVYVNIGRYTGFVTGAQTQPDIRAGISTVMGSVDGIKVRTRVVASNSSPVNAATGTTLSVVIDGDIGITEDTAFAACTKNTTGVTSSKRTTYTCNLGTVAANSSSNREISLELYGSGVHTVSATVSNAAGDYYLPNNNALRNYSPGSLANLTTDESGALAPFAALALLLLALRRHAPHHSLRLRQFLRIG